MAGSSFSKVISSQTVNATAQVNSGALDVGESNRFGIYVDIESGTAPDIQVGYQVINTRQHYSANVGAANGNEEGLTWVTPEQGGIIISSITTAQKASGFIPMAAPFIRIYIKGNAQNGSDTVASVYLSEYHESK